MFYNSIDTRDANYAKRTYHNFSVEEQRLRTERGVIVPDRKAIVRADNFEYLGTVGINWEPVQPEVLYDMAKELLRATDGSINGILNMYNGAVIGISFKLAERQYVANDKIDLSFLMLTAFNGMYGLSGSAQAYRHITQSISTTSRHFYNLKHTKFIHNRIEVVKNMLKYYNQEITSFDAIMNRLVTKPMSNEMAIEWFRSLFPSPQSRRSERILENSVITYAGLLQAQREAGIDGVSGTSYGAWCALTEYVNHHRTVRVHNGRDEEEVRFESVNFGTGNDLIQKGISKITDFHFSEEEFIIH